MKTLKTALMAVALFTFISTISLGYTSYPGGEDYLAFAEVMPAPIGGLEAIYKNIKYPTIAKAAGVEGKVFVLLFIDETGNLTEVKVLKGIGAGCDEEVIEALKKVKFTPGKDKGQPVKVKLSLSFVFKLS